MGRNSNNIKEPKLHCLWKEILSQQKIRRLDLTEYIFRLRCRHDQFLFKLKPKLIACWWEHETIKNFRFSKLLCKEKWI